MNPPRLYYLDNLRSALTFLVIFHHSVEPWATGGGAVPVQGQSLALGVLMGINASFFMGLFLFLSGYFAPPSLDQKGPGGFARGRLLRLGLPALVYAVIFNPLIRWLLSYHLGRQPGPLDDYWLEYLARHLSYAHLWFVLFLLQVSLAYAGWQWIKGKRSKPSPPAGPLSPAQMHKGLLGITALVFMATFLIRIWWPQDAWFSRLGLVQVEPAHVPQYILLFILGCMARNHNWLERLPAKAAWVWLGLGLLPTFVLGPFLMKGAFLGHGFSLEGLAAALREAFSCVGICCGLLIWFKRRFNQGGGFSRWFARRAYTAYIVHIAMVYLVQCWVRTWDVDAFFSALIAFTLAAPLAWILAGLVLAVPGTKRVL
jgi:fucose 4-O-acetylase-like acetyltransferase